MGFPALIIPVIAPLVALAVNELGAAISASSQEELPDTEKQELERQLEELQMVVQQQAQYQQELYEYQQQQHQQEAQKQQKKKNKKGKKASKFAALTKQLEELKELVASQQEVLNEQRTRIQQHQPILIPHFQGHNGLPMPSTQFSGYQPQYSAFPNNVQFGGSYGHQGFGQPRGQTHQGYGLPHGQTHHGFGQPQVHAGQFGQFQVPTTGQYHSGQYPGPYYPRFPQVNNYPQPYGF